MENHEYRQFNNKNDIASGTENEEEDTRNLISNYPNNKYLDVHNDDDSQLVYSKEVAKMLDSYQFGSFHLLIILALGTTWILDGYEVSLVSVLSEYLEEVFSISTKNYGLMGTIYILGAVSGSLVFGFLAAKLGRKKLFTITLLIYMASIILITFAYSPVHFMICRFFTGFAVGGEYSAIFVAIDELLPAYIRGRADLIIDGTWHFGSAVASIATYLTINYSSTSNEVSLRILFSAGAIFAIFVLILRTRIPESPRWLLYKGRVSEALNIVKSIDQSCTIRHIPSINRKSLKSMESMLPKEPESNLDDSHVTENSHNKVSSDHKRPPKNHQERLTELIKNAEEHGKFSSKQPTIKRIFYLLFKVHFKRFIYGFTLMSTQSIFYLGVFYSFNQVLVKINKVDKSISYLYMIPLSVASFLGPIVLGHLFDTYSRRKMICFTNLIACFLALFIAFNFEFEILPFWAEMIFFFITFIFASPAASSAHLTVSEIFPLEMRSQAMAIFFSCGYGVSSISPYYFSYLVDQNSRGLIAIAYVTAGLAMGIAGVVSYFIGLDTENKSLEEINDELKGIEKAH